MLARPHLSIYFYAKVLRYIPVPQRRDIDSSLNHSAMGRLLAISSIRHHPHRLTWISSFFFALLNLRQNSATTELFVALLRKATNFIYIPLYCGRGDPVHLVTFWLYARIHQQTNAFVFSLTSLDFFSIRTVLTKNTYGVIQTPNINGSARTVSPVPFLRFSVINFSLTTTMVLNSPLCYPSSPKQQDAC